MRIFIQFSFFFTEILLAIVQLASGALILREYLRRRNQPHLFCLATAFAIWGINNALAFASNFLVIQGSNGIGQALIAWYSPLVLVGSIIYAVAFVCLYAKSNRWICIAVAVSLAVVAALLTNNPVATVFGQYLPATSVNNFIISYGYWILVHLAVAIMAGVVYFRRRAANDVHREADRMVMIGGLLSMVSVVMSLLLMSAKSGEFTSAVYLLLTIAVVYQYLGIAAKDNPDEKTQQKPLRVITGSITLKVLLACGLFYAVFSFALMSTVTQYFVGNTIDGQHNHIRSTLHNAAQQYSERQEMLSVMAEMLSSHKEGLEAVTGNEEASQELLNFASANDVINIDIVGTDGIVKFSTHRSEEGAYSYGDSEIVANALDGKNSVATDTLWEPNIWSSIAASPIMDSVGRVRGALVISQSLSDSQIPACLSRQGLVVSGCGFISSSGEPIFVAGQQVDALTMNKFRSTIRAGSSGGQGEINGLGNYFVESTRGSQSGAGEVYYAFVTVADADQTVLRVMSVVVLISVLFFIMFAFLLLFGMNMFLKPIFLLQRATLQISQGNFNIAIDHKSNDEIGQLSDAFSLMAATVRERTHRLNEKIREQRDALSHTAQEIRTPLSVFRWSLEMLRFGDVGELNDEQMELLEQMNQTNERISTLVDELLDVSRLERGAVKMESGDVHVEDLVDEIAGDFAVRFREKKIDFYWKHPDKPLPIVIGDNKLIQQVLTHLIGNAVKFTENGGHIEVGIVKSDSSGPGGRTGNFLLVTVKDNGRGIPKKEQADIFGKFYRAANVVRDEIQGTGLGLYLAKQYVEMHGGELWFESKESEVTKFYFTLPLKDK